MLQDGTEAIVCGSHALMITRRGAKPDRSGAEGGSRIESMGALRTLLGDRRKRATERRDHLYQCDTARMLADAFTLNRRTGRDRRVGV